MWGAFYAVHYNLWWRSNNQSSVTSDNSTISWTKENTGSNSAIYRCEKAFGRYAAFWYHVFGRRDARTERNWSSKSISAAVKLGTDYLSYQLCTVCPDGIFCASFWISDKADWWGKYQQNSGRSAGVSGKEITPPSVWCDDRYGDKTCCCGRYLLFWNLRTKDTDDL